ncbi:MAG: TIGR03943 family protein [Anaerolineae bacterium]|nr:TIGR03943 family protein [Anaerolineae bacterium]
MHPDNPTDKGLRSRRWIQAVILLGLGLYFLDNMLSGRVYYYINQRFGWLTWLATFTFLVLGVMNLVDLIREQRSQSHEHDHEEHDAHDHHPHHDHAHGSAPSWVRLGIVGVPLILGVLVPAKPLGAAAVGSNGVSTTFSSLPGTGSSTQFTVAPTERNVLDWVRDFNGSGNVDEFNGQQADLVGFVYRDIRFKDANQFMVARFTVSCCVADASAIGVIVQSPQSASLSQDSWVRVKGTFQSQDFGGQRTPILVAESVQPTDQPEHPYLYP